MLNLKTAALVLATTAAHTAAESVDVFFYSGQSNASGRATTGYTADLRDPQVRYYYRTDGPGTQDVTSAGSWTTLQPLATGYYGAEISMGRALVDQGYTPALIKISDGGTSLAGGWTSRRNGLWWNHWKTDVADALSDLEAQGHTVNMRAFFWMQGESDAHESKTSNFNYAKDFTYFVEDARAYLEVLGYDASELAFVTALIQDFNPPYSGIVRNAQVQVMDAINRGGWFDTADFHLLDDIHFDAPSVHLLGNRFIDQYQAIRHAPEPSSLWLLMMPAAMLWRKRQGKLATAL